MSFKYMEERDEKNGEEQQDMFTMENMVQYLLVDYRELFIALMISPALGYYMYHKNYLLKNITVRTLANKTYNVSNPKINGTIKLLKNGNSFKLS
jgi:hypothetical protein